MYYFGNKTLLPEQEAEIVQLKEQAEAADVSLTELLLYKIYKAGADQSDSILDAIYNVFP